jgi:protein ImuB
VAKVKSALRLVALDRRAEACGLRLGQTLADARGAVPALAVVEADPLADQTLLEAVADWCDRYTPLVALDAPDGLFLDISGCAHLFATAGDNDDDGEAALLADLLRRLRAQGFEAAGAIASTAGTAWAVARYGGGGPVAPGGEAEAVAALPVAALRISGEQEALLDRLGLKRVGQLFGKPRAPLAARFGVSLVTRLDQALGQEEEVISPRRPAPQLCVERRFAEPLVDQDQLADALASLARTLAPALERHGLGARLLEAAFFRVDGKVVRLAIGTASPLRAPDAVAMLFAERLAALAQDWDAGFGFETVRLAVIEAEAMAERQIDLAGQGEGETDLERLYDRLAARLGSASISRAVPVDTHVPERAVRQAPLAARAAQTAAPARAAAWALPAPEEEAPPERPLRLFARPEPVEVIAEVPEGAPLRFRWRRVMVEVARAEGPERIAPEWWRGEDHATRDYFRVEDGEGRRYWLFRQGLYRETEHPVWYVHGLFG